MFSRNLGGINLAKLFSAKYTCKGPHYRKFLYGSHVLLSGGQFNQLTSNSIEVTTVLGYHGVAGSCRQNIPCNHDVQRP